MYGLVLLEILTKQKALSANMTSVFFKDQLLAKFAKKKRPVH